MSNEIFLSYRRSDGDLVARALEESLVYRFGPGSVFLDRDSIKGGFPNNDSLLKLLFMGIQNASKNWTTPIHNWNLTISQLSIFFDG